MEIYENTMKFIKIAIAMRHLGIMCIGSSDDSRDDCLAAIDSKANSWMDAFHADIGFEALCHASWLLTPSDCLPLRGLVQGEGKNMKIHYDTWKYFKRYENRWRSMKTSWNIGKYLEIYERTRDSMKRCWKPTKIHSKWKRVKLWRWIKHRTYENLWKYVETYKNPLGYMKTHQNIWKYMKLHDNAVSVLKIF